jgi:hypothetical protein
MEINDIVFLDGVRHKVLKVHKGIGTSEITVVLQSDDGKTLSILARELDEILKSQAKQAARETFVKDVESDFFPRKQRNKRKNNGDE